MGRAFLVAALCGCGFRPSGLASDALGQVGDDDAPPRQIDAAPGAWLTGYRYRKAIHVAPPAIGSSLANFPIGIVRGADADLVAHARSDRTDLVITASDAVTVLDRELVGFTANGAVELWTRVPAVSAAPFTLYLYYGGPAVANSTAVWSSRFLGVWHLSDAGGTARDSTSHAHDLSATGSHIPATVAGIAGTARSYDGVDDGLTIADPADASLDVGMTSFSFSLWLYVPNPATLFDTPLWKGGTSTNEPGYCVLTGTGMWYVKVHDGTNFVDPSPGMQSALGNRWVHVAGVLDRTAHTFTAYANGAMAGQKPTTGLGTLDNTFSFDAGRPDTGPFRGLADESRLYAGTLSADWIAVEHANLASATFITVDVEAAP